MANSDVPDYGSMREAIRDSIERDWIEGRCCPRPGCFGQLVRADGHVYCDTCDEW